MAGEDVGERAFRSAGILHQAGEGQCTLRYALGMLEQHDIACHELRRDNARDLIVRKVPRLDCQQRAQRARDEFGAWKAWNLFRREERLGVLGVIVKNAHSEVHLAHGRRRKLANLQRQIPRIFRGSLTQ